MSGDGAVRRAASAALAGLAAVGVAASAGSASAAGVSGLLEAASQAPRVVVGTFRSPAPVDRHGFTATLEVERALVGHAQAGSALHVAWEQFGQDRTPRFAEGARWLMALDAFPGGSLWMARFPDALRGRTVWVVADGGGAALAEPATASVDGLGAWLALDAQARDEAAGVTALSGLIADADPSLSLSAVARLDALPALWTRVDARATARLARALGDESRPLELRRALAELAGRRRLEALRPALERAARPGSTLRAAAVDALATLDDGLTDEQVAGLLSDPDPEVRAVALRHAPVAIEASELQRLVRDDPDPAARQAALGALAARGDPVAVDAAARALVDPDSRVRSQAAVVLTTRGEAAVPVLKEQAWAGSDEAAAAATAALALTGPSGRQALAELAEGHPDERMRRLARFVQGRGRRH